MNNRVVHSRSRVASAFATARSASGVRLRQQFVLARAVGGTQGWPFQDPGEVTGVSYASRAASYNEIYNPGMSMTRSPRGDVVAIRIIGVLGAALGVCAVAAGVANLQALSPARDIRIFIVIGAYLLAACQQVGCNP